MTKGYITVFERGILVGAKDESCDYRGPVAEVTHDKDWLHIETDPYEGHVMLNIEALPYLQKALRAVAKERAKRIAK